MKALLRPAFVVGLSIAIAGAGIWTGRAALAAGNAAPTAVTIAVSQTVVVEGDTVLLAVELDSAATAQIGVDVTWGDFSPRSFVFLNPGQKQVEFGHLYMDDVPSATFEDEMTIVVVAGNATTSLSASAAVLVKNAPPTMTSLTVSPSSISAGQDATVNGVFEDLGRADRHTVRINWGDGATIVYPRLLSKTYDFSYAHTYTVGGTHTVTARVTDDDSDWVEASAELAVVSTNEAPSNLLLAMSEVAEGGTSTLTASFNDPDAADTHNITVNWGDGTAIETLPTVAAGIRSFTPDHSYDNSAPYTVTVVLNDSEGHSITKTTSVSVSNVAPSVNLAAVLSPVAGDNLDLSGTFVDPGTADTFTLSVDWGDATTKGTPVLGADGRSFTASHAYEVAGPYTAIVAVTDSDGATGTASANVAVRSRNVPPTSLTLIAPSVAQGATTTATGTFSDSDLSDTHSVVMSWGDGTPVTLSLEPGATRFTTTHNYATAGTWSVSATVTDPAGATTSASTQAVVTARATTTTALLDELRAFVQGLDLGRTTERWLLHRIDELQRSVASGNDELCEALRGLDRLSSVARHALASEQMAALTELTTKLHASVQCSKERDETGQHSEHGPAVITNPDAPVSPTAPKPAAPEGNGDKNDKDKNHPDLNDGAKSDKNDQDTKDSSKAENDDNDNSDRGGSRTGRNSRTNH